jgi:hypothetical protein
VLPLQFAQREAALEIVEQALKAPISAIIAADSHDTPACARASSMMGLKWHSPRAADACLNQAALLEQLRTAGFAVWLPDGIIEGDTVALAAILDHGKMRVLGTSDRSGGSRATPVPKPMLETVLRAAQLIGCSHGPLWASLHIAEEAICGLSLAAPQELEGALRFRIPLVDDSVSLAEVIVRHTLGLDISRVCAISPQKIEGRA